MTTDRNCKNDRTHPRLDHEQSNARSPAVQFDRELVPVLRCELKPTNVVTRVLAEHKPFLTTLQRDIRAAHSSETSEPLKSIRAIDALVSASFRFVSQGPEFLLPGIAVFFEAGETCKKELDIGLPSVREALCDLRAHEDRDELISAHRLYSSPLQALVHGSALKSLSRTPLDRSVEVHCGVPLIKLDLRSARLPSIGGGPIETALLTHSFLTLVEETLHASQSKRLSVQQDFQIAAQDAGQKHETTLEDVFVSKLAIAYFKERDPLTVRRAKKPEYMGEALEIDVVGRIVEFAEECGFPKECLFAELSQLHVETRRDFVRWLTDRGAVPDISVEAQPEFYFKARGDACPLLRPTKPTLSGKARDLEELLQSANKSPHIKAIRSIIGDPTEFAVLGGRAEALSESQMACVLKNLLACNRDSCLPKAWIDLAREDYRKLRQPLAAVVLEEYLRVLGLLIEKKGS
jgi:hypothetical protein